MILYVLNVAVVRSLTSGWYICPRLKALLQHDARNHCSIIDILFLAHHFPRMLDDAQEEV